MKQFILVMAGLVWLGLQSKAQGHWEPVSNPPPDYFNGVSLLLSDGTIMVKACHGGIDTMGILWDKLTPDSTGSYINGTWSRLDSSHETRLYCSSQVLPDGRVYVAGGEYGGGGDNGEIYNPVTNTWTAPVTLPGGYAILDGNSQLLPDGKILQNAVSPSSADNCIFDPAINRYAIAADCIGQADESAWLELPDSSTLFVDIGSQSSERYIPRLNTWVEDGTVPVSLYDPYDDESGAAFLLPDGRAFFIGSTSTSAYYTPSGNTGQGTWAAGPVIPDSLGAPDAAAAMMPNGKILCAFSKTPAYSLDFPAPTWFYEFNYTTGSFTKVGAPGGGDSMNIMSFQTGMLDLPDGNILMGILYTNQIYVYVPGGTPLASGRPVVSHVFNKDCDTFMATGTLFNGISQGADYGDDWQMPTNYPVIRLVKDSIVHYARTFHWNRTGVMTGALPDTVYFTLPAGLPVDTYDLVMVANGIPSAPYTFHSCINDGIAQLQQTNNLLEVYPNPASQQATVVFNGESAGSYTVKLVDVLGRTVKYKNVQAVAGKNNLVLQLDDVRAGIYSVLLEGINGTAQAKLLVQQ